MQRGRSQVTIQADDDEDGISPHDSVSVVGANSAVSGPGGKTNKLKVCTAKKQVKPTAAVRAANARDGSRRESRQGSSRRGSNVCIVRQHGWALSDDPRVSRQAMFYTRRMSRLLGELQNEIGRKPFLVLCVLIIF